MSTNGPGNNNDICRSMVNNIGTLSNTKGKPSNSNMPVKITVLSKNKKRKKTNSLLGNFRPLNNGSITTVTSRYNGNAATNSQFTRSNNEAYAHYLGLQPAVKFKCRKCGAKEFETIRLLNQHFAHCIGYQSEEVVSGSPDLTNQTNLKIVRKVFLCSSCSTYYDSLNLYTHMSLVHNKQICLLCLVMFPYSKDLYSHLIKQHKMTINKLSNVSEMKNVCNGSAFTVSCYCCDAIMFDDNFTAHKCEKICRQCSGKNGSHLSSCNLRKSAYLVGHQLTPNDDYDVGDPVDDCDISMDSENYQHFMTKNKIKENQWERREEEDKERITNDNYLREKTKEEDKVEVNQQDDVNNIEEDVLDVIINTDMEVGDEIQESINTNTQIEKRTKEKGNTTQEEIPTLALTLDDKIEALSLHKMIKECIRTSCICCSYCNNAMKVAVNAKQLIVHLLTKHRYMPTKNDDTSEDIVARLRAALTDDSLRLDNIYLNTESYDTTDPSCYTPFENIFACFQCTFKCTSLKELCLHKKKVHQKNIFLCIMCKCNFSTYSDLMCHLCPGIFSPRSQHLQFRCCFCNIEQLPSSFRLMVHLRKVHHTCDICLEQHDEQQKLLNHMNKHKVHHLCYRCGIAYRSKLDISKHLFWKHGTESVVCKKCLQKKWPHVYHFCIPATSYTCEECSAVFSRAAALTVHKRIHTGIKPFTCELCEHKFISRKLLHKHMDIHKEFFVKRDDPLVIQVPPTPDSCSGEKVEENVSTLNEADLKMTDKPNTVSSIDVSVIPPLNLSSSDSDESDADTQGKQKRHASLNKRNSLLGNVSSSDENNKTKVSYLSNDNTNATNDVIPMSDIQEDTNTSIGCSLNSENNKSKSESEQRNELDSTTETMVKWESINNNLQINMEVCKETKNEKQEVNEKLQTYEYIKIEHSYCMTISSLPSVVDNKTNDKVSNSSSSSGSSSDTESSSSSCGSNCSCSNSSSSSSSSTSDSVSRLSDHTKSGKPKKKKKYKKRKECDASKGKHSKAASPPIAESDLDTDISSDAEDFYDAQPQLHPGKPSLACSSDNIQTKKTKPVTQSPIVSTVVPVSKHAKKKSKQKKAKKKKNQIKEKERPVIVAEQTLAHDFVRETTMRHDSTTESIDSRSSKRKRVRNKFYGYSTSDEEEIQPSSSRIPINPMKKQAKVPSIRILTPIRRPSININKTPVDEKPINTGGYALAVDPLPVKWNLPKTNLVRPVPIEKSHALYCYCRCPYDEVSEMIACDADNCPIEWFHFECVGIMIPPKGKWYCPGCRNKLEKGTHDSIGNTSMDMNMVE